MEISRRIFKNTIFLYGAEIITNLLLFFLMIIIARKLGSEEFGKLAFINSLIAIASVFAELGLTTHFIKEGSRHRSDLSRLTSETLITRFAVATLALAITLIYSRFFISDNTLRILATIAALPILFNVFPSIVVALFRIQERMHYEALGKIISSAFLFAAGSYFIFTGHGIATIIWISISASAGMIIFYFFLFRKYLKIPIFFLQKPKVYYAFFRSALPFAVLAILGTIYFRIDSVMIGYIKGNEAVGYYNAAYKLMEGLLLIPWIFSGVILPVVSKNIYEQREKVLVSSRQAIKFLLIIAFPLVALIIPLSSKIINLLYGQSFAESIPVLQILSATFIAVFISAITCTIINASRRPSVNAYIAAAMVVVNVSLNIVFIHWWGIKGAALATFITEILGLIIGTIYIAKNIFSLNYQRYIARPSIASLIMVGVIYLSPNLLLLPVYGIIYVGFLCLLKGVEKEDLRLIKSLLRREKPVTNYAI